MSRAAEVWAVHWSIVREVVAPVRTVFFPPLKTTCVTLSLSLFATLPPIASTFLAHPALLSLLALSLVSTKTRQAPMTPELPTFSPILRCLGGE